MKTFCCSRTKNISRSPSTTYNRNIKLSLRNENRTKKPEVSRNSHSTRSRTKARRGTYRGLERQPGSVSGGGEMMRHNGAWSAVVGGPAVRRGRGALGRSCGSAAAVVGVPWLLPWRVAVSVRNLLLCVCGGGGGGRGCGLARADGGRTRVRVARARVVRDSREREPADRRERFSERI